MCPQGLTGPDGPSGKDGPPGDAVSDTRGTHPGCTLPDIHSVSALTSIYQLQLSRKTPHRIVLYSYTHGYTRLFSVGVICSYNHHNCDKWCKKPHNCLLLDMGPQSCRDKAPQSSCLSGFTQTVGALGGKVFNEGRPNRIWALLTAGSVLILYGMHRAAHLHQVPGRGGVFGPGAQSATAHMMKQMPYTVYWSHLLLHLVVNTQPCHRKSLAFQLIIPS